MLLCIETLEFAFSYSLLTVSIDVPTDCMSPYAEACQAASCCRRVIQ
jgi:hypothetical protein